MSSPVKDYVLSDRANKFARDARLLMNTHGLSTWNFGWTFRKRAYGLCWQATAYRPGCIELNLPWVERLETSEEEILDTTLHEIAHGLAGRGMGHGHYWKAIAISIGAKPQACKFAGRIIDGGKYRAFCNCGDAHYMHRRIKRTYICKKCKKSLIFLPCLPPGDTTHE